MLNIRSLVNGEDPKKPEIKGYIHPDAYPTQSNRSMFDDDIYDDSYDFPTHSTYKAKDRDYWDKKRTAFNPDRMTVSTIIPMEEIGECADEDSALYNWNQAHLKATEIAYDRIQAFAGEGYESKFEVSFEVVEGFQEFEATITITPTK